jgi:hypothetical protein
MDDWREKGAPVVDAFKVEIRKALAGMDILVNQETPSFCVSRQQQTRAPSHPVTPVKMVSSN